jgi:hypothetical protein
MSSFSPHIWDHCLAQMPATFRARELLQSYRDLEDLYWHRAGAWVASLFSKKAKLHWRQTCLRIIEKRTEIRQLGGIVPPFWSIA